MAEIPRYIARIGSRAPSGQVSVPTGSPGGGVVRRQFLDPGSRGRAAGAASPEAARLRASAAEARGEAQAYESLAAFGKTVGRVGFALYEQQVEARREQQVTDAIYGATEELAELRIETNKDPDTATRETLFGSGALQIRQKYALALEGEAARKFARRYDPMALAQKIGVKQKAAVDENLAQRAKLIEANNALLNAALTAESAAEQRIAIDQVADNVNRAADAGIVTPEQAKAEIKRALGGYERFQAEELIVENPAAARAALGDARRFPNLDVFDRHRLRVQAKRAMKVAARSAKSALMEEVKGWRATRARGHRAAGEDALFARVKAADPKLHARLVRERKFFLEAADFGQADPAEQQRILAARYGSALTAEQSAQRSVLERIHRSTAKAADRALADAVNKALGVAAAELAGVRARATRTAAAETRAAQELAAAGEAAYRQFEGAISGATAIRLAEARARQAADRDLRDTVDRALGLAGALLAANRAEAARTAAAETVDQQELVAAGEAAYRQFQSGVTGAAAIAAATDRGRRLRDAELVEAGEAAYRQFQSGVTGAAATATARDRQLQAAVDKALGVAAAELAANRVLAAREAAADAALRKRIRAWETVRGRGDAAADEAALLRDTARHPQLHRAVLATKAFYDMLPAFRRMTPAEQVRALTGAPAGLTPEESHRRAVLQRIHAESAKEFARDPVAYIAQRNKALHLDYQRWQDAEARLGQAPDNAALRTATATARSTALEGMLAAQKAAGVPSFERRVLPHATAKRLADTLTLAKPADVLRQAQAMALRYGDYWPKVYREVARAGKLPASYRTLAGMTRPGQEAPAALLAEALTEGEKVFRDLVPKDDADALDRSVGAQLEGLRAELMRLPGGQPAYLEIHKAATLLGLKYTAMGEPPDTAAGQAVAAIYADHYAEQEHGTGGGGESRYRVPREALPAVDPDPDEALKRIRRGVRIATMAGLDAAFGRSEIDVSQIRRQAADQSAAEVANAYRRHLQRYGRWVTARDESGVVLTDQMGQLVRRRDGSPYYYSWEGLAGNAVMLDIAGRRRR